ncbi:MAG: spore coat protein [Solirubrobacterales bacterium]
MEGNQLTEKDIAMDLINSSKASIGTMAKVLTETANPNLREALMTELTNCVNSHHRLSDLAVTKGWYDAYANPNQQLQTELSEIK